jgi:hypothetical protein
VGAGQGVGTSVLEKKQVHARFTQGLLKIMQIGVGFEHGVRRRRGPVVRLGLHGYNSCQSPDADYLLC